MANIFNLLGYINVILAFLAITINLISFFIKRMSTLVGVVFKACRYASAVPR